MKKHQIKSAYLTGVLFWLLTLSPAWSATYFIAPTGNDSNSGTFDQPWGTFVYSFSKMVSGDTLIVKDGTYNEDIGTWHWSNNEKIPDSQPPNGKPASYTQVKSENIGKAVVQEIAIVAGSYVRIEGLKANSGTSVDWGSSYIELKKLGSKGGIKVSRSSYITKEDVWAWGKDRYVIHNYDSHHIIDNRVIARLDESGTTETLPVGAISHYLTDYSVIANALLFDVSGTFTQPFHLVYSSRPNKGFNKLWGIIGFNSGPLGGIYPGDGGSGGHEVNNSVIWGSAGECVKFNSSGPHKVTNTTCGNNADSAIKNNTTSDLEVSGNIFFNNAGGIPGSPSICNNNLFYQSGDIPINCTKSETSDPSIKWLPRSSIPGKGANIEKRYVISETNGEFIISPTNINLWPWPYEDLIKADMCEGTTKGWCGTNKTLTQYIWEYLGNPTPPEYLTKNALNAPQNLRVQ